MGYSVYIKADGSVHALFVSLDGSTVELASAGFLDCSKPHIIGFRIAITDRLGTYLSLSLDGEVVAESSLISPFLLLGDPFDYNVYVGRQSTESHNDVPFTLLRLLMYDGSAEVVHKGDIEEELQAAVDDLDGGAICFEHGAYFFVPSQQRDGEVIGTATYRTLRAAMATDGFEDQGS